MFIASNHYFVYFEDLLQRQADPKQLPLTETWKMFSS